jgi:hypothetical protein
MGAGEAAAEVVMKQARHNLTGLFWADALEGLTAEQVARLEGALNADPRAAAQLANLRAAPEGRLKEAVECLDRVAMPSAATWNAVWARIEVAGTAQRAARRQERLGTVLRLWQPLAAIAACLLLALTWWGAPGPERPDDWPVRLASNARISSLEVGPDLTPVVMGTGPHGASIIWIVPEIDDGLGPADESAADPDVS